jgi:tetratricopeptide (TPR) repeat protein
MALINSQNIPRELLNAFQSRSIVDDFIYNLKKFSLIVEKVSNQPTLSFSIHQNIQSITLNYLEQTLGSNIRNILIEKITYNLEKYAQDAIEKEEFNKMKILVNHFKSLLNHKNLLNNDIEGIIKGKLGTILCYLTQDIIAQKYLESSLHLLSYKNENYARIARYSGYLGCIYRDLGNYKKARIYLEQSLRIYQERVTEKEADLSWILVNLGTMYKSLEDYENARIFLEKAIKVNKKKNFVEEVHIAWVYGHLASIYSKIGNNAQAKALFEYSLSLYEKNYDINHPKRAWILTGLGIVYRNLSHYDKAKYLINKGIEIYKVNFSEDSLKIGISMLELGQVYLLEGNLETAEIILNESLVILKKNKSMDVHIILEMLAELNLKKSEQMIRMGNIQQAQKFKTQAIEYFNQSIEIRKTHLAISQPHQLIRIKNKLQTLLK